MTDWIFPCNPNKFNVIEAFNNLNRLNWTQPIKDIEVGSLVYIYVASPIKAIKYKCRVNKVNLSKREIDSSEFVIGKNAFRDYGNYMELELLASFDDTQASFLTLKRHGLKGSIQSPMRITHEISKLLISIESMQNIGPKKFSKRTDALTQGHQKADSNNNASLSELIKLSYAEAPSIQTDYSEEVPRHSSIAVLNLSTRSYNALRRGGIHTIPKLLIAIKNGTLLKIQNLGEKSHVEIIVALTKRFPDTDLTSETSILDLLSIEAEAPLTNPTNLIDEDRQHSPIATLKLPVRSYNMLIRAGIHTIPELLSAIRTGAINNVRNIGPKSRLEIVNTLTKQYPNTDFNNNVSILELIKQLNDAAPTNKTNFIDKDPKHEVLLDFLDIDGSINAIKEFIHNGYKSISQFNDVYQEIILFLNDLILQKFEQSGYALSPDYFDTIKIYLSNIRESSDMLPSQKASFLLSIYQQHNLKGQIESLFSSLVERERELFLAYEQNATTLETLGKAYGVTRERIRQILSSATNKLISALDIQPLLYLKLALEIGRETDLTVTKEFYFKRLIKVGLLQKTKQDQEIFNIFLALLLNEQTHEKIGNVPENLNPFLKRTKSGKSLEQVVLAKLPKQEIRTIKREISYMGGIEKKRIKELLDINEDKLSLVLSALNLKEIIPNWYSYKSPVKAPEKEPIIRYSLLLHQCCGGLPITSFLEGVQRGISRHYPGLSPEKVALHYLSINDFEINDSVITYSGETKVDIPRADELALSFFRKRNRVVTTQEINDLFQKAGYSQAMVQSKVLPESPIIERVELGFYRLRGSEHSVDELQTSRSSQIAEVEEETAPGNIMKVTEKVTHIQSQKDDPDDAVLDKYYSKFISARQYWLPFTIEEEETIQKALSSDDATFIYNAGFQSLERIFYNLLMGVQYVGDLTIGHRTFEAIAKKTKSVLKKPTDIRKIPPSVFLIGLVFCARYAETSARNFWTPYANQVWGVEDVTQSIANHTRAHFRNVRLDFEEQFSFTVETEGELVRPVFQHAIIPSHLQNKFSDWIIEHFDDFLRMEISKLELPKKLAQEIPSTDLRSFLTEKDTQDTSIKLVEKMIKALSFYQTTTGVKEIDSLFVSQIERNIWKRIYEQITTQPSVAERLKKAAPRLQWVWDTVEHRPVLRLKNIKSEPADKPDMLILLKDYDFNETELEIPLSPGRFIDGSWIVENLYIPIESPEKRNVFVISEEFDFQDPEHDKEKRILYENAIPNLPNSAFFELSTSRYAERKTTINHSGEWVIISKSKMEILDNNLNTFLQQISLPQAFSTAGYNYCYKALLQLPVVMQFGDSELVVVEDKIPTNIDPKIFGETPLNGLSPNVPPIFRSTNITFEFTLDPKHPSYKNTYLYLSKGKKVETKRLSDLYKIGLLVVEGNRNSIKLNRLLDPTGNYSVNLINNLDLYFPSSMPFSVLPPSFEIEFDNKVIFSPNNLPNITLHGLDGLRFMVDHPEVSIESQGSTHNLKWKMIRDNTLHATFHWKDMVVPLMWDIERVTSWLEGSSGPQRVDADDIAGVRLEVRGAPGQQFLFKVQNEAEAPLKAELNATGAYSVLLSDTQLPDWTRSLGQVCSEISVIVKNDSWKFFNYWYTPSISISKAEYKDGFLDFEIEKKTDLKSDYSISLESETDQTIISLLANQETLDVSYHKKIDLVPGKYCIVISSFDVPIVKSDYFEVTLFSSTFDEMNYSFDSNEYISAFLCADYSALKKHEQKYKSNSGLGCIEQIMSVNRINDWFEYKNDINEHDETMFIKLLPAWAVTSRPLLFDIIKHERTWQVFPERALLGGRIGAGYLELNVKSDFNRFPIYWFTQPGKTSAEAFIFHPPTAIYSKFSEIKMVDMFPMYHCQKCGLILNPSGSTPNHFPKSVWNFHLHGFQNKANPFTDLVYEKHIEVKISQVKERSLIQTYSPYSVIKVSDKKPWIKKINKFDKVIDPYSNHDFNLAISQESSCRKNENNHTINFRGFLNWVDGFSSRIPALAAWHRLIIAMSDANEMPDYVFSVFTVALLSRMKSRYPRHFAQAIKSLNWDLDTFITNLGYYACNTPLTLEWCTFWAEVFFVHAIS